MDIISFVMGLQKGKASAPEMQEKTVKITENGTTEVLPDDGCALSKVTVNTNVESSGSGDGLRYFARRYTTLTGTWGERVTYSAALGFQPDILIVIPYSGATVGTANCIYISFSDAMQERFGSCSYGRIKSDGTYTQSNYDASMTSTDTNVAIYNADETGFNFGKSAFSGSAVVWAFGL